MIPIITSNVSVMAVEPEANPLRQWLESLQRFRGLPDDLLVLPAHNTPFRGLHRRLEALIEHHEDHLLALEEACVEPRTTMESVSYTHLRAHETVLDLVCRLLLEKKTTPTTHTTTTRHTECQL